MNAYRLAKSDFSDHVEIPNLPSHGAAIQSMLSNSQGAARHEHVINPLVPRAAAELIGLDDKGVKTRIEAYGKPYDVLQEVAEKLLSIRLSVAASRQILESLAEYMVARGAEFSEEVGAKPLYVLIAIVNKKPDDLPKFKTCSFASIDAERIKGQGASTVVMNYTIHGTSTSMTSEMGMDELFRSSEGKKLFFVFGEPADGGDHAFETVDADLSAMIQALGGGALAKGGDSLRAQIEAGTIAPEIMQLIKAIAEVKRLTEASRTPGAAPNAAERIMQLQTDIASLTHQVMAAETLPPVLVRAMSAVFDPLPATTISAAEIAAMVADNERGAPVIDAADVSISVEAPSVAEQMTVPEADNADMPVIEMAGDSPVLDTSAIEIPAADNQNSVPAVDALAEPTQDIVETQPAVDAGISAIEITDGTDKPVVENTGVAAPVLEATSADMIADPSPSAIETASPVADTIDVPATAVTESLSASSEKPIVAAIDQPANADIKATAAEIVVGMDAPAAATVTPAVTAVETISAETASLDASVIAAPEKSATAASAIETAEPAADKIAPAAEAPGKADVAAIEIVASADTSVSVAVMKEAAAVETAVADASSAAVIDNAANATSKVEAPAAAAIEQSPKVDIAATEITAISDKPVPVSATVEAPVGEKAAAEIPKVDAVALAAENSAPAAAKVETPITSVTLEQSVKGDIAPTEITAISDKPVSASVPAEASVIETTATAISKADVVAAPATESAAPATAKANIPSAETPVIAETVQSGKTEIVTAETIAVTGKPVAPTENTTKTMLEAGSSEAAPDISKAKVDVTATEQSVKAVIPATEITTATDTSVSSAPKADVLVQAKASGEILENVPRANAENVTIVADKNVSPTALAKEQPATAIEAASAETGRSELTDVKQKAETAAPQALKAEAAVPSDGPTNEAVKAPAPVVETGRLEIQPSDANLKPNGVALNSDKGVSPAIDAVASAQKAENSDRAGISETSLTDKTVITAPSTDTKAASPATDRRLVETNVIVETATPAPNAHSVVDTGVKETSPTVIAAKPDGIQVAALANVNDTTALVADGIRQNALDIQARPNTGDALPPASAMDGKESIQTNASATDMPRGENPRTESPAAPPSDISSEKTPRIEPSAQPAVLSPEIHSETKLTSSAESLSADSKKETVSAVPETRGQEVPRQVELARDPLVPVPPPVVTPVESISTPKTIELPAVPSTRAEVAVADPKTVPPSPIAEILQAKADNRFVPPLNEARPLSTEFVKREASGGTADTKFVPSSQPAYFHPDAKARAPEPAFQPTAGNGNTGTRTSPTPVPATADVAKGQGAQTLSATNPKAATSFSTSPETRTGSTPPNAPPAHRQETRIEPSKPATPPVTTSPTPTIKTPQTPPVTQNTAPAQTQTGTATAERTGQRAGTGAPERDQQPSPKEKVVFAEQTQRKAEPQLNPQDQLPKNPQNPPQPSPEKGKALELKGPEIIPTHTPPPVIPDNSSSKGSCCSNPFNCASCGVNGEVNQAQLDKAKDLKLDDFRLGSYQVESSPLNDIIGRAYQDTANVLNPDASMGKNNSAITEGFSENTDKEWSITNFNNDKAPATTEAVGSCCASPFNCASCGVKGEVSTAQLEKIQTLQFDDFSLKAA